MAPRFGRVEGGRFSRFIKSFLYGNQRNKDSSQIQEQIAKQASREEAAKRPNPSASANQVYREEAAKRPTSLGRMASKAANWALRTDHAQLRESIDLSQPSLAASSVMDSLKGQKTVLFIGYGTMSELVLREFIKQHPNDRIIIVSPNIFKKTSVPKGPNIVCYSSLEDVQQKVDIAVLGMKPQKLSESVAGLEKLLKKNALIVSMLAGKGIDAIKGAIYNQKQSEIQVLLTMPSTLMRVGDGVGGVYAGDVRSEDYKGYINSFVVNPLMVETPEEIRKVTAAFGSGPAYFFALAQSISDSLQARGVTLEDAPDDKHEMPIFNLMKEAFSLIGEHQTVDSFIKTQGYDKIPLYQEVKRIMSEPSSLSSMIDKIVKLAVVNPATGQKEINPFVIKDAIQYLTLFYCDRFAAAAEGLGFEKHVASLAMKKTCIGACTLALNGAKSAAQLRADVTSTGGTTFFGTQVLLENRYSEDGDEVPNTITLMSMDELADKTLKAALARANFLGGVPKPKGQESIPTQSTAWRDPNNHFSPLSNEDTYDRDDDHPQNPNRLEPRGVAERSKYYNNLDEPPKINDLYHYVVQTKDSEEDSSKEFPSTSNSKLTELHHVATGEDATKAAEKGEGGWETVAKKGRRGKSR